MTTSPDSSSSPVILVAEDNDVSRALMVNLLSARGFRVLEATDGGSAIRVIMDHPVDLAFVDQMMAPRGGLDVARYVASEKLNIPIVLVTASQATDLLIEATRTGVHYVLQKPVQPDRLIELTRRILQHDRQKSPAIASETHERHLSDTDLMARAINLAKRNVEMGHGGPFGAVVADAKGRILGEGVNGITTRCDPLAHAEIAAIQQAAAKLGKTSLAGCRLYCSSEPTTLARALIASVGIEAVYFGLTHDEVDRIRHTHDHDAARSVPYTQIEREAALEMFRGWLGRPETARIKD